jgi:putative drug exporter of the RND superfamily
MLRRVALTSYRRRRRVLLAWVVLLVGLSVLAQSSGGAFNDDFRLPGSESQEAFDLLEEKGFENRSGFGGQVVVQADGGVDQPDVQQRVEELFARIEAEVPDAQVVSPFDPGNERQISEDGTIAYAEIQLADRDTSDYTEASKTIRDLWEEVEIDGARVELGGELLGEPPVFSSEGIGLLAAIVILLIAFGSLLAMGLPIVTALFGIGCGIAIVELTANVLDMPSFATQAAAMIGIGVGIDYALLIVTRYRQSLRDGFDPEGAVLLALDTAGRSVLFAGATVVISLLGMLLIGLDAIHGLAVGTALAVLLTMAASVTLLPALLGFVGRNIDKLGLPHRKHAEGDFRQSFWHRWSRVIQRRPWPAALVGLAILLLLAAPVFSLRLGFSDTGNRPTSDTTRRAYDLLSEGFGPGSNSPFVLVAETPDGEEDLAVLGQLSQQLNQADGVQLATPPQPNEAGDAAVMTVIPETAPQDKETANLVEGLRDQVIPPVTEGTGVDVKVGGLTPVSNDFADYSQQRLPIFIGAVLALSFLLLMTVFRSLLVPLKAVIVNLLSIGAAYGVVVAVFQWGWGRSLVGVGREGPIEAWAPMMLFAIVFGLSMDYEVFLLSRIREEYDRTGDNALAVADGLAATARVITAAAAIMFFVFGSFVLGDERALKLFGMGLAVAVLVDATVVRLVLVPATMELLGDRNWWLPQWLERVLPSFRVEGATDLDRELSELTAQERARSGRD